MGINLVMIVDFLSVIARFLLQLGAATALGGAVASFLAIVVTWGPASKRRKAAANHRSKLQAVIDLPHSGSHPV